jgi:acyl-CoA reductase-like NAD-dependent aldehyde dehydrogenase
MKVFAGMPDGLVACLPGGADVGRALVDSPKTHAVAFTGSVKAGQAVAEAAARRLKPCVIEAGGSDPMIITAHAPIAIAAAGAVTGAFHMSGQVCTSTERMYVVDAVHDAFVAAFVAETQRLRIGNGLQKSEIGPLVSEAARDKVARLVEDAVAQGATIECGGRIPEGLETGWFYAPTILTNCTPDMAIMRTEIFGPVLTCVRAKDYEEALGLAMDHEYGNGTAIFTRDGDTARDFAARNNIAMVGINGFVVGPLVAVLFVAFWQIFSRDINPGTRLQADRTDATDDPPAERGAG